MLLIQRCQGVLYDYAHLAKTLVASMLSPSYHSQPCGYLCYYNLGVLMQLTYSTPLWCNEAMLASILQCRHFCTSACHAAAWGPSDC